MDKLQLKEPVSPVLSRDLYALFQNDGIRNPSTSVTFPQKSKTPQEFRNVSTAASDDPRRIQPRLAKPFTPLHTVDPKLSVSRGLGSRQRSVKRPTNIDVNTLRVLRPEAEDEEHSNPPSNALETKPNKDWVSVRSGVKASEVSFRGERDRFSMPVKPPQPPAACSTLKEYDELTTISFTNTAADGDVSTTKVSAPIATTSKETQYFTLCSTKPKIDSATKTWSGDQSKSPTSDIITLNGQHYKLMRVVGVGGSSKVYEAYNSEKTLMAIKCVNLASADQHSRESYVNEINLLKRLQHSDRVIKMFDYEYDHVKKYLFVALERGDTDFATYLASRSQLNRITAEMIKFYWSEMLRAVEVIHNAGIIHSDLKPGNFLIVKGHLKLIDFGISSVIPSDVTSIIKDIKAGSISYMSPEALIDTQDGNSDNTGKAEPRIKIGVKSDVWSLGCILYHMAYGVTPFHNIRDAMKMMWAIVNPAYNVVYPPLQDKLLLDVMQKCIVREPKQRASIKQLLAHPYLTGKQENNLDSFLNELMVKLSPSSTDKVQKALEELQLDKMSAS